MPNDLSAVTMPHIKIGEVSTELTTAQLTPGQQREIDHLNKSGVKHSHVKSPRPIGSIIADSHKQLGMS